VRKDERLQLSAQPGGFGFFYGWVEGDGERVRVDVLPPAHLWRGGARRGMGAAARCGVA
jgi:hypothetical protein